MQRMQDKMREADSNKVCAFQEIKIRDYKEYYPECKLMYPSQNKLWSHECRIEICPMYQAWQLLKESKKIE